MDAPVKITGFSCAIPARRMRRLSVTGYAEWVLATSRSGRPHPCHDRTSTLKRGAILAHNTFGAPPFRAASPLQTSGPGSPAQRPTGPSSSGPRRFACRTRRGRADRFRHSGPALDPCAALQRPSYALRPATRSTLVFLIGQSDSATTARALIAQRIRSSDPDALLAGVTRPLERRCWHGAGPLA